MGQFAVRLLEIYTNARHLAQPRPRHCCHAFSIAEKLSEKLTYSEPNELQKCRGTGITFSFQTKISFPKKLQTRTDRQMMRSLCSCNVSCPPDQDRNWSWSPRSQGPESKINSLIKTKLHHPLPPPDSLNAKCVSMHADVVHVCRMSHRSG